MSYGIRWKQKTLRACGLTSSRRMMMGALLILCDWKGRVKKPYHEITQLAGVSSRYGFGILHSLIDDGFLIVLERGSGRRPSMLQIVPVDQVEERSCAAQENTATKTVAVLSVYVDTSVNCQHLVEQSAQPRAGVQSNERSEHGSNGSSAEHPNAEL